MGQPGDDDALPVASMAAAVAPTAPAGRAATEHARQPRDLQGMLRWSAALGASAPEETAPPAPMDAARRAFLTEAFTALTVDEVQLMKDAVARVREPADPADAAAVAVHEAALDELQGLVESLDNASGTGAPAPGAAAQSADKPRTSCQICTRWVATVWW
jgi:hypothetical protein